MLGGCIGGMRGCVLTRDCSGISKQSLLAFGLRAGYVMGSWDREGVSTKSGISPNWWKILITLPE